MKSVNLKRQAVCVSVCVRTLTPWLRQSRWLSCLDSVQCGFKRSFSLSHFATAARKWSTESLGKHRETVHTGGTRWGNKEKIYSHTSVTKERKSLIPLFHPGAKPPELMTGLLNHRLIVGKELKGGVGEGLWRERERRSWERQISRRGQGWERTETGERKKDRKDKKKGWNVGSVHKYNTKRKNVSITSFFPCSCHHHGNP